jgi:hypothetical protein
VNVKFSYVTLTIISFSDSVCAKCPSKGGLLAGQEPHHGEGHSWPLA